MQICQHDSDIGSGCPSNGSSVNTPIATPSTPSDTSFTTSEPPFVVLVSNRAVLPDFDTLTPATLVLSPYTGKILFVYAAVLPPSCFPPRTPYHNHSPYVLLPGLVDAHVHLNEPGRTEWEGFWTGTRAAAFGGVTTVCDMPLNALPPTTTVAGLNEKVAAAKGKCWVDVGFHGGVIPGNENELSGLVDAGVRGFKGFLIDSGVPEFPHLSSEDVGKAMVALANKTTTLMFHAEMLPPISDSVGDDVQISEPPLSPSGPLTHYQTFLDSRPPVFETHAVDTILSAAHLAPKLHLHIVHVSAMEVIPLLRKARRNGINITAETCFHYLALAAESVKDGDTRYKCCPPIRSKANQEELWKELLKTTASGSDKRTWTSRANGGASVTDERQDDEGVIRTVVSDHSPCTVALKILPKTIPGYGRKPSKVPSCCASSTSVERGDFFAAWGGVSSVGLGLPILWTERYYAKHDFSLHDVVMWCATNTAIQVGLQHRKGALKPGLDADVVVFDDEGEWEVRPSRMLFRNKCSAFEGMKLRGIVRETWLRGVKIFERNGLPEDKSGFDEEMGPKGDLILEKRFV